MEQVLTYSYDLTFNKSSIENQIILWKVNNYNSYITDFTVNNEENTFSFKTSLSDDANIMFTYFVDNHLIKVNTSSNTYLLENIDLLNNENNLDIAKNLSKLEQIIENIPEDKDSDDTETDDSDNKDKNNSSKEIYNFYTNKLNSSFAQDKMSNIVSELNQQLNIHSLEDIKQSNKLTIFDDSDDDNLKAFQTSHIKTTLLTDSDSSINLLEDTSSDIDNDMIDKYYDTFLNNLSKENNLQVDVKDLKEEEVKEEKVKEVKEIVEEVVKKVVEKVKEDDLTDIMISSAPLKIYPSDALDNTLPSNKCNTLSESDPYNSLILSDSDFLVFYENLNVKKDNYCLNEKDIITTSIKILEKEPKINNEEMKKYAFNELSIIKMIIKEVLKTCKSIKQSNTNKNSFDIKIIPDDNNIFKLNVSISNLKNPRLLEEFNKYKEINPDFDNSIKLTIDMPKLYYPYAPPIITINEPKFDDVFLYSLATLDYFKQEYWNPSNTIENVIHNIIQMIESYGTIDKNNLSTININNHVIKLWSLLSLEVEHNKINIDFVKLTTMTEVNKNTTKMASGTGYSNSSSKDWDVKKYLSEKKNKTADIITHLKEINTKLLSCNNITDKIINLLPSILDYYLYDVNILEITNKIEEYVQIVIMLTYLQPFYNQLYFKERKLSTLVASLIKTVNEYIKMIKNNDNDIKDICNSILELKVDIVTNQIVVQNDVYDCLKEKQFSACDFNKFSIIQEETKNGLLNAKRILREFSSLQKSLPFNYETSIFFRYCENSINKIKFLIIGPKDTPYQDGCYIFDMLLPTSYPLTNPRVNFLTTGKGTVRFNPNLYNNGKVCLSLLGTWQGETWNENSTILQVLVSIQSLILIDHPYFNEPGYQSSYGTPSGMETSRKYNEEVQSNNIRWAIIDNILNPVPEFADIIKTHFSIKKNEIIKLAEKWEKTNNKISSQIKLLNDALDKL